MARKTLDQLSPAYRRRVESAIRRGKASAVGRVSNVSKTGKVLSPAYVKRLERGLAKGKSRQEARGHKAGEANRRREREIEEKGISSQQNDQIRKWYRREFNPQGQRGKPREEEVVAEVAQHGYDWFREYRSYWRELKRDGKNKVHARLKKRRQRARAKASATGRSEGSGLLTVEPLQTYIGSREDFEFFDIDDLPDPSWLFYQ